MAVVTLSIRDETQRMYVEHAPTNPNKAMAEQLEKYKELSPKDKGLVLTATERGTLEGLYGGSLENGAALVAWVEKLKSVTLEETRLRLTDGQRKRLESEAYKQGKTAASYIEWRLADIFRREFGF